MLLSPLHNQYKCRVLILPLITPTSAKSFILSSKHCHVTRTTKISLAPSPNYNLTHTQYPRSVFSAGEERRYEAKIYFNSYTVEFKKLSNQISRNVRDKWSHFKTECGFQKNCISTILNMPAWDCICYSFFRLLTCFI